MEILGRRGFEYGFRRRTRFALFWLTSWVLFFAMLSGCGERAADRSPDAKPENLLLITLDTVRADHLGSYGHPDGLTPNLDRLAARGIRFAHAISTAAVTPVSHASILTGRNPYSHGLRVFSAEGGFRLPPDVPALAGVLKGAGFRTGAVHSSFAVSGYFGFRNGFDFFDSFEDTLERRGAFEHWKIRQNQRRADQTTDIAIDFVNAAEEPFFLWVHYWDMHDPILLPDESFMPPREALARARDGSVLSNAAIYSAEIRYVDHHLGRLLDALEDRNLDRNTLVAVVSDHGEGLGEHGWFYHRLLYEEQIHVPLLFRIPGVEGGKTVGTMVRTIDLFPTVLDYLGLPVPAGVEGRSLRNLIEGREEPARIAYADQINLFDKNARIVLLRPDDALLFSVQDGEWKLIYRPLHPERSELFHLSENPGEQRNLFDPRHPEVKRLLTELAERDCWLLEPPTGEKMDSRAGARLEALGYVKRQDEVTEPIDWSFTPVEAFGARFFASRSECEAGSDSACVPVRTPADR